MALTNTYIKRGFWKKTFHPVGGDLSLDEIIRENLAETEIVDAYQEMGSQIKYTPLYSNIGKLTASTALASGTLKIQGPYLVKINDVISGIIVYQPTKGVFTPDAYNGVALYSYDGSGTATLVASSINDPDIWRTVGTGYVQKAFSTPYSAAPGVYFTALLYHSSAATQAPFMGTQSAISNAVFTLDFPNSARISGTLPGQSAFPLTFLMSGLVASIAPTFPFLY